MKGRGLDRVPTLIETHSWSTPNGFQASQDDPSIGLLRDAECLPGTNTTEHNPAFRIDYSNGHGGKVPLVAAYVNLQQVQPAARVGVGGADTDSRVPRCAATDLRRNFCRKIALQG